MGSRALAVLPNSLIGWRPPTMHFSPLVLVSGVILLSVLFLRDASGEPQPGHYVHKYYRDEGNSVPRREGRKSRHLHNYATHPSSSVTSSLIVLTVTGVLARLAM